MRYAALSALAVALLISMPTAAQQEDEASVTFEDQEASGSTVVVAEAVLPDGGFIVIHDDRVEEDPLGSAIGESEYLEPGEHMDVEVQVAFVAQGESTLYAMLHEDTNGNEEYDFEDSEGQEDGAYTANGEAVMEEATITWSDDNGGTDSPGATDGNGGTDGPGATDGGGATNGNGGTVGAGREDDGQDTSALGVVGVLAAASLALLGRRRL